VNPFFNDLKPARAGRMHLIFAILCVAAACTLPPTETPAAGPIQKPPDLAAAAAQPARHPTPGADRATRSLSDVFERVVPSVVVLLTEERKFSREHFGVEEVENSIGTGFVISKDGLIMTAAHVVQVVDRIIVRFHNGWEEEAQIVAAASRADVALIRLNRVPENLQVAKMGDSTTIRIGDPIFVVGAPFGIEFTLTAGRISGRRTQAVFTSEVAPIVLLQTDAAINRGNSGGPMFNMDGQVIGIVSEILTRSGGFEGVGFAVSVDTARDMLLKQGAFWSGVEFYPVTGALAAALNISQGAGLLVQRVAKNAPAERLQILPGKIPVKVGGEEFFIGGDVVIAINGIPADPSNDEQMRKIRQSVNDLPAGGSIRVEVLRGGKRMTLTTVK
jgi:S1-C subfamily serine protease